MKGPLIIGHETGTVRGWRWHRKSGTVPCKVCCRAWAIEQWNRRLVGACAKGLGWPLEIAGRKS